MYWILNHLTELDDTGLECNRPGFYPGSTGVPYYLLCALQQVTDSLSLSFLTCKMGVIILI